MRKVAGKAAVRLSEGSLESKGGVKTNSTVWGLGDLVGRGIFMNWRENSPSGSCGGIGYLGRGCFGLGLRFTGSLVAHRERASCQAMPGCAQRIVE